MAMMRRRWLPGGFDDDGQISFKIKPDEIRASFLMIYAVISESDLNVIRSCGDYMLASLFFLLICAGFILFVFVLNV